MEQEICYWVMCFVPIQPATKIFGFAEYISALALLVVVFTTADTRYKFRVAVAPIPLLPITFWLIGLIGLAALLPEVWAAQKWWVPRTCILTVHIWQAFTGLLFLSLLLTWMYYAFLRPPVFGKRNAVRYGQALYHLVLKGSDAELAVIADELALSARSLVHFAHLAERKLLKQKQSGGLAKDAELSNAEQIACDMLFLIGNRKLCKNIVLAAPNTAQKFFEAIAHYRAYQLPVRDFAQYLVSEAIANKDSILYEESDEYTSTLIGHLKPFSAALFGNHELVDGLEHQSPLSVNYFEAIKWDADQWRVYCASVFIYLDAKLKAGSGNGNLQVMRDAFGLIESAVRDLDKLDGNTGDYWSTDIYQRLRTTVEFIQQVIELIDEQPQRPYAHRTDKTSPSSSLNDVYAVIAELVYTTIESASRVSHTSDACWGIHHNAVWAEFFPINNSSPTAKVVAARVRRRIVREFVRMKDSPNFLGARLLGITLNVTGLGGHKRTYRRHDYAIGYLARQWAKKEFLALLANYPDVAQACLTGSISLDAKNSRLIKTYAKGTKSEPTRAYLDLKGPGPSAPSKPSKRPRTSSRRQGSNP